MSESFQQNAEVLQARWPEVFSRLLAEDSESLQVELVEGLIFDGLLEIASRRFTA